MKRNAEMKKRLTIVFFVIVGLILASAIKMGLKNLAERNRDARKVLVMPQIIRFEDGTTDEASFPSRPSVKDQLDHRCREVVICGVPSVGEVKGINCKTSTVELVERLVDARYLSGTGNLRDVIRLHFRPDIGKWEQVCLALCEVGNCLCFGAYTSLLACNEIESGRGRLRREQLILVQEMTRKVVEDAKFTETGRNELVSRQIEQRAWYKPDIYHDRRDVCTTEQRDRATVLMEKRTKIHTTSYAFSSAEWSESPNHIHSQSATTNAEVKVLVVRQVLRRTNKWTESEKSYRWKWFMGHGSAVSDKYVTESEHIRCADYVFTRNVPDLGSFQTVTELERELTRLKDYKTREIVLNPIIRDYVELTSENRFEDGAITYLTGGSIANLFIKPDLGYELGVMDWVWAGVDVASIAITAATWGTGGTVAMAGKTVAMVAAKQGAKLAIRAATKATVKSGVRAATRTIARRVLIKSVGLEIAIDGMCLTGGSFANPLRETT